MKKISILLGVSMLLAACGTTDKMEWARKSPDEFMTMSRAPLYLPPEYDNRPLVEFQKKPSLQEKFKNASRGEKAFLKQLEITKTNENIRAELDQEMSIRHD